MKGPRVRAALACAFAAAAVLHLCNSLGNPVGVIEDDAVQVMLARSLRHGGFALPDADGAPLTDPLPGLAALLLIPVWLVEPRWGLLRALWLAGTGLTVWLTWRLARRLISGPAAAAAALLTALSPALVSYAGIVVPDIPLSALLLLLVYSLADGGLRPVWPLSLGAALASLLRPQGALVIPCLAAAILKDRGRRRCAVFLATALLPLAAWILRNRSVAGTATGYLVNWRSQQALLAEPKVWFFHGLRVFMDLLGEGLLGLTGFPYWIRAAAALAFLALAGAGCLRLMRGAEKSRVFALSAFSILLLALHWTWVPVTPRYVIPLAGFAWILAMGGLEPLWRKRPAAAWGAVAALGLLPLRFDLDLARAGLRRPREFQPKTMAWIREHTPASARVESLEYNAVLLLTGRTSLPPSLASRDEREWFSTARAAGIDYLHIDQVFDPGGFLPSGARLVAARLENWARTHPSVSEAYRDESERTRVFRLTR